MPTYERRYHINKLIEENDKRQEEINKINNKNKGGR